MKLKFCCIYCGDIFEEKRVFPQTKKEKEEGTETIKITYGTCESCHLLIDEELVSE